jgi:phosphatidylglycerol---prolipoprotein diacylglyceryl transferase
MTEPFHLNPAYAITMVLAFLVMLSFRITKHFAEWSDKKRYYTIQMITLVAAVIGAKIAVLLGDALWPLKPFDDWYALAGSGRSIVGALLLGFIVAELAKPILRYDIPPNDRFAVALPVAIGIGRIGCLIVGCCGGIPYDGPFAITYADGIPRYPVQAYEMLFDFFMAVVLFALCRRQILFGRLFALYLVSYGIFRFFIEFIRETAKPYDGLSASQLMCVLMVLAGALALIIRTAHQPDSWAKWREAGARTWTKTTKPDRRPASLRAILRRRGRNLLRKPEVGASQP